METSNRQGWLNKNLKAIIIIIFLIIFLYLLFNPKKIMEIKNVFTGSKSLNVDSLKTKEIADTNQKTLKEEEKKANILNSSSSKNKDLEESRSEKDRKRELEDLRQKNKDLIAIVKNTTKNEEIKIKGKEYKENRAYTYMYILLNPTGTKRKFFSSREARQRFIEDKGLVFIDQKDNPVKVIGEGPFSFGYKGIFYRFIDLFSASEAINSMGLPVNTTILEE